MDRKIMAHEDQRDDDVDNNSNTGPPASAKEGEAARTNAKNGTRSRRRNRKKKNSSKHTEDGQVDSNRKQEGGESKNDNKPKKNADRNNRGRKNKTHESSSPPSAGGSRRGGQSSNNNNRVRNEPYPPHLSLEECLARYNPAAAAFKDDDDGTSNILIRGKLRVLPGNDKTSASFVACDRGLLRQDVIVEDYFHRNRALDGDIVFLQLLPSEGEEADDDATTGHHKTVTVEEYELSQTLESKAKINESGDEDGKEEVDSGDDDKESDDNLTPRTWQDDETQMDLWNPQITLVRQERLSLRPANDSSTSRLQPQTQRRGRVVHVVPPKVVLSELEPDTAPQKASKAPSPPRRRIVGSLMVLQSGTILLTPNNKSLPQFKCPQQMTQALIDKLQREQDSENGSSSSSVLDKTLFRADYVYGSWQASHKNWPPCVDVEKLGDVGDIEDEIEALLSEFQVDHGDFPAEALKDVDDAVRSGVFHDPQTKELCWKPTASMYQGRRDYRKQRIFTIDPTTAKDLDDALHITELEDGTIEVGVHIADVSFFVRPDSAVDHEALRRATTVYLVDRTVPMLPRPLCEVACSLNENVERLAFSCVWRMNSDGTLRMKKTSSKKKAEEDVWYGRTVIKSCARLDYATAQNIIENKVAATPSDKDEDANEELWPKSRRPTGGHTMQQVAADVRLMHRVAKARRRLRFENGALALDSVKLTFQLDADGQTPLLAAPYPIRDSNRLVEEYMLLANYLVAQRLITHAKEKACLRHHPPPLMESIDRVAAVAKAGMDFSIDYSSSESLHKSLVRLGRECHDPLVLKCVTQMLTLPMQQAVYFCAGTLEPEMWRHFALNMPYYTHFTSPIRRYPDVMVHRLLQATIDGEEAVARFPLDARQIQRACEHCCEKQKASKEAQQRCDRVFLSLYLRTHPIHSELGIVLSVGKKAFTVYIPSLGADALLYLDEHKEMLTWADEEQRDGTRRILLQQKPDAPGTRWNTIDIRVFTKVMVTVVSKDMPPIDIKLKLEGPWP